jgi:hypothetical protein
MNILTKGMDQGKGNKAMTIMIWAISNNGNRMALLPSNCTYHDLDKLMLF